jgi:S-formylglutathione hydrolase FrmB
MHKNIKCVVISPAATKELSPLPVVYLLHGYDGIYSNWITKMPVLKKYANEFQCLIVCPDGGNSWYLNSNIDTTIRFETFIADELVSYIDNHYKSIRRNNQRAITGLSMGGHGAFSIAIRHPDIFGAAGSMSGVFELRPTGYRYGINKLLGDTLNNEKQWNDHTVLNLMDSIKVGNLQLIFDCGSGDPFIGGNRLLHQKLMNMHIAHDYIERQGGHSWEYWINAVPYHLLFFKKFFDKGSL